MKDDSTISSLVVPIDTSEVAERAIPWAKVVAGETAAITLLEVIPVASAVRSFGGQVMSSAETIQAGYQEMAEKQLAAAIEKWFPDEARVNGVVSAGDPSDRILAIAEEQQANLIVMSSHGRGAIGRFVSGSVADRVVRHAPVPVMIVGPEGDRAGTPSVRRIMAPIDDSELSLAALPVAAALAKQTGAPVEVVHVLASTADSATMYPSADALPLAGDDRSGQTEEAGQQLVDRALERLQALGVEASGEVASGRAGRTILGKLRSGDIVVLSSHQREGFARWVLGSTSTKLIQNGTAPVVIVTRESIERAGTRPAVDANG